MTHRSRRRNRRRAAPEGMRFRSYKTARDGGGQGDRMKVRTMIATMLVSCGGAPPPAAVTPPATGATVRPAFDPASEVLAVPADYRSWTYLTSGFQMSYGPAALAAAAGGISTYDTVFVDPAAHAAFVKSGVWPDRTMFVLEVRTAEHTGSIVTRGNYQTDLLGIEAEIKDARLPGGWGFFAFDADEHGPIKPAK